ncbi:unnamed protein product [Pleuronectes platessa]|uniref:Plus3 domain-containing protein n=1 Tax=Pleuronectes platessa TaxID=8262 RepID=A0A9N7V9L3_PLEPL|nr:unnamed protein product [Pleuronectes platessa]
MLLQPVDKWSAAASGRSAGTKWKMQVEQDKGPGEKKACGEVNQPEDLRRICLSNTMIASKEKCIIEALDHTFNQGQLDFTVTQKPSGPEEKKACVEVTQPALPPEELRRICLSDNGLEKWSHMPSFATTVTGCFIRAVIEDSILDPPHCVAEIVSEFTESEFKQWEAEMIAAGMKFPTPEMIATKDKSIKEALDPYFTQGELDFNVDKKKRFRAAPLNVAKRKITLVEYQSAARSRGDADMVERKFLVASAASAASGRSAGTKRERLVEQDKGPEEKKACVEVTQPALPPEELRRICLSDNGLEKWSHMPSFATTVTGCFIRAVIEDSILDPPHCVAEIVSEFTESEFKQWEAEMIAAGMKFPTPEMIATKDKSIKEALDPYFTQGELDFNVDKKKRFRAAPLNVAKRKITLVEYQSAARSRGDADMVERKFLVASAASAASGRSAGTKRERLVEQDKGPEEKKACVEVNQPALSP